MMRQTGLTAAAFFSELDEEFHGISSLEDGRFTYQAREVLVQSTWELPIIIQWPKSSIQFTFTTAQGGVEFGIVFVPATVEQNQTENLQMETIEEMIRVRSDLAPVSGTFQPPCEGVVFFLWDNAYDWRWVLSFRARAPRFNPASPTSSPRQRGEASVVQRAGAPAVLLAARRGPQRSLAEPPVGPPERPGSACLETKLSHIQARQPRPLLVRDQDTARTRRLDAEDQLAFYTPQVNPLGPPGNVSSVWRVPHI